MRSMWKGAVSFGLVMIPVKLYTATEQKDIAFRQVHREDGGRIRFKRFCTIDDTEVPYEDIAKGYELADGEVVVLTEDDMAALPLPTTRNIEVVQFCPTEQLDPILFNKSYYVEPEAAGVRAYCLLRDALEQSGKIAIAQVALRQRESLAVLRTRDGVLVLGSLGFENAYALAMRRSEAAKLGIASLDDLAAHAGDLTFGADLEFLSRPEWASVRDAYHLKFRKEDQYQPTFMYRALMSGQADVISAFSSDGRIAADELVVLSDPRHALPPYDAVLLISPKRAGDARLIGALKPLVGKIPVDAMRAANLSVDRDADKATPAQAAKALETKLGL